MSNFEDTVLSDIEDRATALFEIEKTIFTKRYNLAKKHYNLLSVQSIAMIYSIWEDFIKKTFKLYINEINDKNIKII